MSSPGRMMYQNLKPEPEGAISLQSSRRQVIATPHLEQLMVSDKQLDTNRQNSLQSTGQ